MFEQEKVWVRTLTKGLLFYITFTISPYSEQLEALLNMRNASNVYG